MWLLYVLRSDSIISLLVSTTVIAFNRKLQKSVKNFIHMQTFNMSSSRRHFTSHSLHMNLLGKTENMTSIIKTLFSPKNSPLPITLTWRDESDYSTEEEKVHLNQTNDIIVQNNVIDTCNSDHDILNVVCVNHALDSTTHFQLERSEDIKKKVC